MSSDDIKLVGAVDQGTSSSRFLIFNSQSAELVTYHQTEITQIFPHEGWVEVDAIELLDSVNECIENAVFNLKQLGISPSCIQCVGITNQRETTVVWDRTTGRPLYRAIVWLDLRTASTVKKMIEKTPNKDKNFLRTLCGLPITTYFSAVKLRWLLDNCSDVREAVKDGRCLFGTVDSWLVWNLTGGVNGGGKHLTDVTNASRTMLMNIHSLQWDSVLCKFFEIPVEILPTICSSSEIYGYIASGTLSSIPISGILGDQQAALVGQACFHVGQAKNTYGTGCFLLCNTGHEPVESKSGLLTTVAYKFGEKKAVYALEGAIAIAGACVQWLRDNLGIISSSSEIETLALEVKSTHGCYFVPAFSGLFCPHWQDSARGIICGLTQFTRKSHIARAVLEAVCFQTRELLEVMNLECGLPLTELQVDGGMTVNNLLMQLQADILQINIVRPSMTETTALGAAVAAGTADGINVWNFDDFHSSIVTMDTFLPSVSKSDSDNRYAFWMDAVKRSMNWESVKSLPGERRRADCPWITGGEVFVCCSFAILVLALYRPK